MYLELAGYVPSVRNHCVDRDTQVVGNLLIRHPLYQCDNHILLTVREGILILRNAILEHHV